VTVATLAKRDQIRSVFLACDVELS